MSKIVVGVDGSRGSKRALEFAIDIARSSGDEVEAVNAWHIPPLALEGAMGGVVVDPDEFKKSAAATLEKTVSAAVAEHPEVTLTSALSHGQAAQVLCEAADGAKLLVVGSRGLGGFTGLLLGSVSQQCAEHARCPVVIIPKQEQDNADG